MLWYFCSVRRGSTWSLGKGKHIKICCLIVTLPKTKHLLPARRPCQKVQLILQTRCFRCELLVLGRVCFTFISHSFTKKAPPSILLYSHVEFPNGHSRILQIYWATEIWSGLRCTCPGMSQEFRNGRTTGWNFHPPMGDPQKNDFLRHPSNHWSGLFMIHAEKINVGTNKFSAHLFCWPSFSAGSCHVVCWSFSKLRVSCNRNDRVTCLQAYINHLFGKIRFTITLPV